MVRGETEKEARCGARGWLAADVEWPKGDVLSARPRQFTRFACLSCGRQKKEGQLGNSDPKSEPSRRSGLEGARRVTKQEREVVTMLQSR